MCFLKVSHVHFFTFIFMLFIFFHDFIRTVHSWWVNWLRSDGIIDEPNSSHLFWLEGIQYNNFFQWMYDSRVYHPKPCSDARKKNDTNERCLYSTRRWSWPVYEHERQLQRDRGARHHCSLRLLQRNSYSRLTFFVEKPLNNEEHWTWHS